jgi:retinol dehydrogenase-12
MILDELKRNEHQVEMTLAINHFGPFYLTYLLFPLLKTQPEARIINVSSLMHFYAPNQIIEDIECRNKSFGSNKQYAISKFMNVLFTQELFRKISKYQNIKTCCLHPGIVDSNFGSDVSYIKCFTKLCCCIYVGNAEGARTSIHLST